MGKIAAPGKIKLIMGLLANSGDTLESAVSDCEAEYGSIDYRSEAMPFTWSEYYKGEMGADLLRQWISFEELIDPGRLADIKITTNQWEDEKYSEEAKRSVNFDPGLLYLSRLVLASTKDYCHRVYLQKGIFAEVTMIYTQKDFQLLPWTYSDYADNRAVFHQIRKILAAQIEKG